ncbi:hypothetical protein W824_08680 [Clavibacter cf. michiganensis LMG 26808]|uniref:Uncharacterized protein n=1 Tax=Clavibacter michiganensis TaxID=28447 RepID=A0A399NXI6_9MICO|nr:hypothetical protein W824_08680 [Clavibacter cf. michiganensis LMG 26808]RII98458.1 hypothetical protein DZF96_02955 [Clavibacter michiganensis]
MRGVAVGAGALVLGLMRAVAVEADVLAPDGEQLDKARSTAPAVAAAYSFVMVIDIPSWIGVRGDPTSEPPV